MDVAVEHPEGFEVADRRRRLRGEGGVGAAGVERGAGDEVVRVVAASVAVAFERADAGQRGMRRPAQQREDGFESAQRAAAPSSGREELEDPAAAELGLIADEVDASGGAAGEASRDAVALADECS